MSFLLAEIVSNLFSTCTFDYTKINIYMFYDFNQHFFERNFTFSVMKGLSSYL